MIFFIKRIFSLSRLKKQFVVLLFDIFASLISTFIAFTLRLDTFSIFYYLKINVPSGLIWVPFLLAVLIFIPFFIYFGLYRSVFRYSGLKSLINILLATIFYGLSYLALLFMNTRVLKVTCAKQC